MNATQESVDLRREQLQKDLDDATLVDALINLSGGNLTKVIKFLTMLTDLPEKEVEDHFNILFEQQKESVKETGKMGSPENIKKVLGKFYEEKKKVEEPKYEQSDYIKQVNIFELYCSVCGKRTEIKTSERFPVCSLLLKESWHIIGKRIYCSVDCYAQETVNGMLLNMFNLSEVVPRLEAVKKVLDKEIKRLYDKDSEIKRHTPSSNVD